MYALTYLRGSLRLSIVALDTAGMKRTTNSAPAAYTTADATLGERIQSWKHGSWVYPCPIMGTLILLLGSRPAREPGAPGLRYPMEKLMHYYRVLDACKLCQQICRRQVKIPNRGAADGNEPTVPLAAPTLKVQASTSLGTCTSPLA